MNSQQWFCIAILLSLTFSGCIEPNNQQASEKEEVLVEDFTHPWNGTEQCLEHEEDQRLSLIHI